MPDENTPRDPNAPEAPPLSDTRAEAMLDATGENDPPLPTVLANINPEEHSGPAMGTAPMSGASGGMWQPPTVEEAASLFPNYEIISLLGRGGMGAVYKARQIELDRFVAIKLLPLEISVDQDFADRFRREARAMAKLNHPNIIAVYDFGTTNAGHLFFVMEFVDGANLHQIIHGPGLDPAQTLAITIQVCEALAFAHEQGVVHRDIKPANVMVDQRGRAKVADFGLARLTDPSAAELGHTMTGTVMGTPDYMAPEQMRGMNVDHRADIYSLGVMLYEMLCKDVPRGIFDPPSHRVNGVDARIDQVVIKAMQQQPDRRYQQTTDMRVDVDQIRASMVAPSPSMVAAVGKATPKPKAPDQPSAPRKSRIGVSLAIAAVVLVLGGLAFVLMQPSRSKTKTAAGTAKPGPIAATTPKVPAAPPDARAIRIEEQTTRLQVVGTVRWSEGVLEADTRSGLIYEGVMSRDAIVRASVKVRNGPQLILRHQGGNELYRFAIIHDANRVQVEAVHDARSERLGNFNLPRAYAEGEWLTLEARAIGDELTVLVDGKTIGTVKSSIVQQPGGMMVYAPNGGSFRDIVYVPLDTAVSTPAPAATAATSTGWQSLFTDAERQHHWPGKREWIDGSLHLIGQGLRSESTFADGAIRARIRFKENSSVVGVMARVRNQVEGYKLNITAPTHVALAAFSATGKNITKLGHYDFPKPLEPGEVVDLELRVQSDRLTGLVNGVPVIEARDTRYPDAGFWQILANDGWFESAEVQTLGVADAPATPPTAAAPAEKWVDAIAEWKRKFPNDQSGFKSVPEGIEVIHEFSFGTTNRVFTDMAARVTARGVAGSWGRIIYIRHTPAKTGMGSGYSCGVFSAGSPRFSIKVKGENDNGREIATCDWPAEFSLTESHTVEFRAQGDRLSVAVDGREVLVAQDSTYRSGGVMLHAAPGTIYEKFEYRELTASTPASAPTNEPWRDWIAEKRAEKTFFPRFDFEDDGQEVRSRFKSSASWAHAFQAADGAIRATWRLGPKAELGFEEPLVRLRYTDLLKPGGGSYRAQITTTDVRINEDNHGEIIPREIAKWPLPQGFDRAKEHTLELRAVGDLLSVKLNGELIGQARDSKRTSGGFGFVGGKGSAIRKMEYLSLDKPGAAVSGWQPLLPESEWQTHWPGKREFVDGRVHLIAFSLLKPMPAANGAIRARIQWREGSRNVALIAREVGQKKGNYKLTVNATGLALNVLGDDDKVLGTPGLHDFAQPLDKGAVLTVELRLQDDHLTVLLDGATVITAQNSAHPTAGAWGIIASNGWFESVEVQPLPAADNPAPQTEEKWRDWLAEARDKTFFPSVFTEAGGKLVVARTGGLTWEYSLMARDMAVRATWLPADLPPLIPEVMARTATDGTGRHYAARVVDGKVHLSERRQSGGTTSTRTIQEWPLPAGLDPKAEQVLELRVVADLLTVRLNGQEIGSARDSALTHSGTAGAFATKGTVIRKLEYLNLDPPASTTASQPAVSEKWEDLIAAGGWPAPFTIENGVLTRPTKTLAQRKWNASVRDCAWRVTRRWDGGWYDLQLGLRSRGNKGVRLAFLDLPQPDVILVRITSNEQKLGEGKTTRRYKKGDIITIEFRAVGTRITASIDGELVASAEEHNTTDGSYDFWTNYGDAPAYHKVEFLNLDGAAAPPAKP